MKFKSLFIVIAFIIYLPVIQAVVAPSGYSLEPRIRFWMDVFSKYGHQQYIFHDTLHPYVVYNVVDFSYLNILKSSTSQREMAIFNSLKRTTEYYEKMVKKIFISFCEGKDVNGWEEKKILRTYRYYLNPEQLQAKCGKETSIRYQQGMKESMKKAIEKSGKYMTKMELIFRRYKLPIELTRLVFVESMFNQNALSNVGASGIWQFMPETARMYLTVNDWFDERISPIKATFAAARLLRQNFKETLSWEMAVTAYNHGMTGVKNAIRKYPNAKPPEIIETYEGNAFGFASRNFYSEFIAVARVYAKHTVYFGEIDTHDPVQFKIVAVDKPIGAKDLLNTSRIDESEFRRLNPDIKDSVYSGNHQLPRDYILLIPLLDYQRFKLAYGKSLTD